MANVGLCSGSSVTRKSPRKTPETALTGNLDAADVGLCSSSSVTRTSPVAVGLKRRLGFSTREDVESGSCSKHVLYRNCLFNSIFLGRLICLKKMQ